MTKYHSSLSWFKRWQHRKSRCTVQSPPLPGPCVVLGTIIFQAVILSHTASHMWNTINSTKRKRRHSQLFCCKLNFFFHFDISEKKIQTHPSHFSFYCILCISTITPPVNQLCNRISQWTLCGHSDNFTFYSEIFSIICFFYNLIAAKTKKIISNWSNWNMQYTSHLNLASTPGDVSWEMKKYSLR